MFFLKKRDKILYDVKVEFTHYEEIHLHNTPMHEYEKYEYLRLWIHYTYQIYRYFSRSIIIDLKIKFNKLIDLQIKNNSKLDIVDELNLIKHKRTAASKASLIKRKEYIRAKYCLLENEVDRVLYLDIPLNIQNEEACNSIFFMLSDLLIFYQNEIEMIDLAIQEFYNALNKSKFIDGGTTIYEVPEKIFSNIIINK